MGKRNKPTYFGAITSVALVLFMIGLYLLIALQTQRLVQVFRENVDIWVEIKPETSQQDIATLLTKLEKKGFVKNESISYITKEQAAEEMKTDLGEGQLLEDLPSMMHDIVRFNVRADYLHSDSLTMFRTSLKEDPIVSDLFFDAAITDNVTKNVEKIAWFTLGLGFLLIFAALILIHNTVRLALYANRFLIKNQELVGATWDFIARPYVKRGVWTGFLSALFAIAALCLLVFFAEKNMPSLKEVNDRLGMGLVFSLLVVIGMLISGISSYVSVRKYLGKKIEELY